MTSDPAKGANKQNADNGPPKVGCCAYAGYYLLVFFAYWFGASRFDMDGDGDFDVEDVALYIGNRGKLKQQFTKTKKKTTGFNKQASTHSVPGSSTASSSATGTGTVHSMVPSSVVKLQTPGGSDAVEAHMTKQSFPLFIVLQTLLAFGLWFAGSLQQTLNEGGQFLSYRAGMDTFAGPGLLDLRIMADGCEDMRFQLWRAITYQWTHVGISHVFFNSVMNVLLGIPLEGLHGHFRVALMYNIGVFGGACCYWVGDARRSVVGMSGGCYALIGIHVANLLMNWNQMKFRRAILLFLTFLITIDITLYLTSVGSEKASHTAHVGGAIAGLIIATLAGKNVKVEWHERVLQCFAIAAGGMLVTFCVGWLIIQDPPRHLQEVYGWCWLRQIYSPERFGNKWQCVQCANKDCIESFQDVLPDFKLMVSWTKCPTFWFEGDFIQR